MKSSFKYLAAMPALMMANVCPCGVGTARCQQCEEHQHAAPVFFHGVHCDASFRISLVSVSNSPLARRT